VFIGPKDDHMVDYAAVQHDQRIIYAGPVDVKEKSNALAACTIFCMPSRFESLGATYLEAWSYGKPVIAADIPTSRELTGDGKGGMLVQGDADSISTAILYMLDHPVEAREMGQWGKAHPLKQYNWETISVKMNDLYEKLVREDA
jgi:glycosyltransferase involved in cell wall biosynthesis